MALVLAVSAALALTACGAGTRNGRSETPLMAALAQVRDSANTRSQFYFSQPNTAEIADGGQPTGPYSAGPGAGLGPLGTVATVTSKYFGLDVTSASSAIEVGAPPNTSGLITGVSTADVPGKLQQLGATKSGTTYRLAPDHSVKGHHTPLGSTGLLGLNVVQLDSSEVRYATAAAGLEAVDGSGSSLAGDPAYRSAASCLGDPLAAELADPLPHSATAGPTAGVLVTGIGLSGRRGVTPTETMCVVASSASIAAAIEKAVRAAVTSGLSATANRLWSQLLPHAVVRRTGSSVSLTAHSTDAIVLFVALERSDLPGVSG